MRKPLQNPFIKEGTAVSLPGAKRPAQYYTASKVFRSFLFCVVSVLTGLSAFADYTVASGANINATAITGQSGILTINGTLTMSSNVSLSNFTSVIINAPNGQINWITNADLTFTAGTTIVVNSGAPGLQPISGNGNASQRLIVGGTIISVSSDNSNNAAFSFEEFNQLGGLPQFTITASPAVCLGSAIALTITPDRTSSVSFSYSWSISPSSGTFTSNTGASTSITPSVAATYTITCAVKATGDPLASKTVSVVVAPFPTLYSVTGGGAYCAGGAGIAVGLAGSEIGVDYQLKLAGVNTGSPVQGTGAAISFGTQTSAGTYTVVAANAIANCSRTMTGSAAITVIALPTLYSVTGGGAYCNGSSGIAVGLGGSQGGVTYQLKKGGVNTGSPLAGTGAAISFGTQTSAGTYTIVATNSTTTCSQTMTGSAAITVNALPTLYSATGGGAYCIGSTGVEVGLGGSQSGVNYQLKIGGVNTGSPVAGTGAAISFGLQTSVGTYTIVATSATTNCSQTMTGSAAITVNAVPTLYSVTGGGVYCSGSTGVAVGLGGSQSGVNYQLKIGGDNTGSPVAGTGAAISFGTQTSAGTYTVIATNATTNCTQVMTNNAVITINELPVLYSVTGGGPYCAGSTGVMIGLEGSQGGINYQLRLAGVNTGSPVAGTGSAISFGTQTSAGTYTVVATNANTTCIQTMTGNAVVTINALPPLYSVTGGGWYCAGSTGVTVGLGGSQSSVNYQLKSGEVNTGNPVAGTGSAISFGLQTSAGTYTVVATNATTTCSQTMTGSAIIANSAKPTASISGSQMICNGSSATLSIHLTGNGPWNGTLSNGQTFSGNNSPITISVSPVSTTTITIASLSDANCTAIAAELTESATITVGTFGEWRGITTDWNDGQNWCTGAGPTAGTNITIPATANNPIISSGTAFANNLTIAANASVTLTDGTLKISGAINSSQAIIITGGTLEMTGSSAQAIAGSNFSSSTINNLTVSNPAGLVVSSVPNDLLKISGALAFGNVNNSTITTGDNIVLVSNAFGTARVADVTNNRVNSGNGFNGKVVVERYYPARRSWRLFTAPLSGAGSIFDNWQNKGVYKAGVGTYVTGANASIPTGANGIDWSALNTPSLKVGASLVPVTNTKTNFLSKNVADTSDNIAYFIFVRGDRDPLNTNPALKNNTTLSSTGKLQTGRQTFPAASTINTFTLVGNPYASPIDFGKLVRNNITKRFWVWDPSLNAEQGGYVTIDDVDNDGIYSTSVPSPSGMNHIIQSGQSFFVQTASNNPASLVFLEEAKSATTANLAAFRFAAQHQSFRATLYDNNGTAILDLLDGTVVEFDKKFNKEVDIQDAAKFGNAKNTISVQRNSTILALERRPLLSAEDTIFLVLANTTQRSYQLAFEPEGLDPLLSITLEDSYTGTSTILNAGAKSKYAFVINSNAASADSNRFRIVFKQITTGALPVTFKTIKATKQTSDVAVEWTVKNEINTRSFEVERSADGTNFVKVNATPANTSNAVVSTYQFLDNNAANGNNYYRVQSIGNDGKSEYSKIVLVKIENASSGIRIYPNPVTNNIIRIEFKNMIAGTYKARVLSSVGQTILRQQIIHGTGSAKEYIQPAGTLTPGIYQLEITTPNNTINTVKVIVK
ncbi:MAG: T9SS type A sorting domain-containing protein [Ferruginibacter sp.]